MKRFLLTVIISVSFLGLCSNAFGEYIKGGAEADTLNGTPFNDEMYGLGGNDVINGMGFDDLIYGGFGDDDIDGGSGWWDGCSGGGGSDVAYNCTFVTTVEFVNEDRPLEGARSADNVKTIKNDTVVVAHDDLVAVSGGTGQDIILFPANNMQLKVVDPAESNGVILTVIDNEKVLDIVMGALSFAKVSELVLGQAIEKDAGLCSIPLSALSTEEAVGIAKVLFTDTENGITMKNPMSGKTVTMKNVDYIGFRNTPLIPVQ